MKHVALAVTFAAIVAIVAGGVWALRKPAEASKPSNVSSNMAAPAVQLAPGEVDIPENRLAWRAPDGSAIALTVVARGDHLVVRAFTATDAYDVTKPELSDSPGSLHLTKTGAAFVEEMVVGREPEVGALSAYWITRIEWVHANKQLAAIDTWSCDESEQQKPCQFPAWAEEVKP